MDGSLWNFDQSKLKKILIEYGHKNFNKLPKRGKKLFIDILYMCMYLEKKSGFTHIKLGIVVTSDEFVCEIGAQFLFFIFLCLNFDCVSFIFLIKNNKGKCALYTYNILKQTGRHTWSPFLFHKLLPDSGHILLSLWIVEVYSRGPDLWQSSKCPYSVSTLTC